MGKRKWLARKHPARGRWLRSTGDEAVEGVAGEDFAEVDGGGEAAQGGGEDVAVVGGDGQVAGAD